MAEMELLEFLEFLVIYSIGYTLGCILGIIIISWISNNINWCAWRMRMWRFKIWMKNQWNTVKKKVKE